MARTKQIPIKGKYSKTLSYRHTYDKIDRGYPGRTPNYVTPLTWRHTAYQACKACKAKWEAQNLNEPYPHPLPQPDGCGGGAACK